MIGNNLIQEALAAPQEFALPQGSSLIETEINQGLITGIMFRHTSRMCGKGIIFIHGFSGNRHGARTISRRFATLGYIALSIDLPQHYKNTNAFTVGLLSKQIIEAVKYLRTTYNIQDVTVAGHSMGSIGALFSLTGMTPESEVAVQEQWNTLIASAQMLANNPQQKMSIAFLRVLITLRNTLTQNLANYVANNAKPTRVILLASPISAKKALPFLSIFPHLPAKVSKFIFEKAFHEASIRSDRKEGVPESELPGHHAQGVDWQYFHTPDIKAFLTYFLSMKEPWDYLELADTFVNTPSTNKKVQRFQELAKDILYKTPKLTIYGDRDAFLLGAKAFVNLIPGMHLSTEHIESKYRFCQNIIIKKGRFTHMLNDTTTLQAADCIKDPTIFLEMVQFINQN